ncbi:uncharacterized protein LOC111076205 [Drosophila obscura]|uniref:uncharacterized protein LOC111076205 n=1 Tax=Drosophila obscura TaxID=7282 RepID=UPI001BB1AF8B|nr:uncharacterized protein LOC111076205 [Drosophila obscura]
MDAARKQKRVSFLRIKSTKLCEKVKTLAAALEDEAAVCDYYMLLVKLEQIEKAFKTLHNELEELDCTDIHSGLCDSFGTIASALKASIMSEFARISGYMTLHSTFPGANATADFAGPQPPPRRRPGSSLPSIQLPRFSGGYADWTDFYSMFKTIIDNHPYLSNIDKFQHLRSCLRDSALETVRLLEISDINYNIALDLLKKRFNNRRLVFHALGPGATGYGGWLRLDAAGDF